MNVYMTNGTVDYLSAIQKQYPDQSIFLLENEESGLAYYEGEEELIFKEGRVYETVDFSGEVLSSGFVVMNNIPVRDEGRPIFEDRFKNRAGKIEEMPGFQAIRILRPKQGNTYIVFTQ